ncbi:MAG TPA: hypothetical protein VJH71_01650 [Candidatus Paceibacterota bacterium]
MSSSPSSSSKTHYIVGGLISTLGTFRQLWHNVRAINSYSGSNHWSPRLLDFPSPKFNLSLTESGGVIVKNLDNQVVLEIEPDEIFYIYRFNISRVLRSGYISPFQPEQIQGRELEKSLEDALRGHKPLILDNSPFLNVGLEMADQKVIEMSLKNRVTGEGKLVALDMTGKVIESITDSPLSYERWGQKDEGKHFKNNLVGTPAIYFKNMNE